MMESDLPNCPKCGSGVNTYKHPWAKVWCPKCGYVLREEGSKQWVEDKKEAPLQPSNPPVMVNQPIRLLDRERHDLKYEQEMHYREFLLGKTGGKEGQAFYDKRIKEMDKAIEVLKTVQEYGRYPI